MSIGIKNKELINYYFYLGQKVEQTKGTRSEEEIIPEIEARIASLRENNADDCQVFKEQLIFARNRILSILTESEINERPLYSWPVEQLIELGRLSCSNPVGRIERMIFPMVFAHQNWQVEARETVSNYNELENRRIPSPIPGIRLEGSPRRERTWQILQPQMEFVNEKIEQVQEQKEFFSRLTNEAQTILQEENLSSEDVRVWVYVNRLFWELSSNVGCTNEQKNADTYLIAHIKMNKLQNVSVGNLQLKKFCDRTITQIRGLIGRLSQSFRSSPLMLK